MTEKGGEKVRFFSEAKDHTPSKIDRRIDRYMVTSMDKQVSLENFEEQEQKRERRDNDD